MEKNQLDLMLEMLLLTKKIGFSLLELMLVLAIGSILTLGIISFIPKKKKSLFFAIEEINTVFNRAYTRSLLTNSIYKVRFLFEEDVLNSLIISPFEKENSNLKSDFSYSDIHEMREKIIISSLIINEKNELAKGSVKEVWVLVYPEGYSQEVTLSIKYQDENQSEIFILHPFFVEFFNEN